MNLKRDDVVGSLTRKGFHHSKKKADHDFYTFRHNGKKTAVYTKVSRGTKYKTLGDTLVSMMAKQCRLSVQEFAELVKCTLSAEEYEKKLLGSGHL